MSGSQIQSLATEQHCLPGLSPSESRFIVDTFDVFLSLKGLARCLSASTHGKSAFTQIEVPYSYGSEGRPAMTTQMLWPDHCVRDFSRSLNANVVILHFTGARLTWS